MFSKGWKSTYSLCGKTQEYPSQTHLTLPFLMCPLHHASPLHCVGMFPKTHSFPLISFLSRHLELLPAGSCHPSCRPGQASQATSLLSRKPKQPNIQHGAAGATCSETTQLPGLLCTEDDKSIYFSKNSLTYLRKNRSKNYQQGLPQEGCKGSIFHHKTHFEMYLKFVI